MLRPPGTDFEPPRAANSARADRKIAHVVQAVTAYALEEIQDEFYGAGATYVVMGEPEERGIRLLRHIESKEKNEQLLKVDGIGFRKDGVIMHTSAEKKIENLDSLAFAAWELFPVQNYWKLKYAHGPLTANQYLPILIF